MLRERGTYPLSQWRSAWEEFNRSGHAARSADNHFNKDWFDEVLAVLYFAEWTKLPDATPLEMAPPKVSVWDFKLGGSTVQVTIALPDWRELGDIRDPLDERQFNPGVQRARRGEKLSRDGFVSSHALVNPNLEYVHAPGMRSREEGIKACKRGIEQALGRKACKAAEACDHADMLLVYGAELNAFGPEPRLKIFESMLENVAPPQALSEYKSIIVLISAPGWIREWASAERRWRPVSNASEFAMGAGI